MHPPDMLAQESEDYKSSGYSSAEELSYGSEACYRAIKKNFTKVSQAISRNIDGKGLIVDRLYEISLVDDVVMDVYSNQMQSSIQIGRLVTRQLQASLQGDPSSFETLTDIFMEENCMDLARVLNGTYNYKILHNIKGENPTDDLIT